MNSAMLEQIVEAVLYEGYILYPYRASSKKNQRERFTFGRVYPEAYSLEQNGAEPHLIQTECLVALQTPEASLTVSVRFLQPMAREIGVLEETLCEWTGAEPQFQIVPELRVGNESFQPWHEAIERRVDVPPLMLGPQKLYAQRVPFRFAASRQLEPIHDGQKVVGVLVRRQADIEGIIEITPRLLNAELCQITVRVLNQTSFSSARITETEPVLMRTLASTHTVLNVEGGEFISLTDPPPQYQEAASLCRNRGTWPVLVGDELRQDRDTILSSPIILYDYPKIAPESTGPLFDGTEIDEILTLRILTMTDREKVEMRKIDERARRLLERTEALSQEALLQLHGLMGQSQAEQREAGEGSVAAGSKGITKLPDEHDEPLGDSTVTPKSSGPAAPSEIEFDDFFGASTRLKQVQVGRACLREGSRVRLRPKARADLLDLVMSGETAIIEAVEQDAEQRIHLAVVLENDPGKDLGFLRQPGHRFFYGVDEVEVLAEETE